MGRRKFLLLGGAGAAVLASSAGIAAAIKAGLPPNDAASPRSQAPVGLDPIAGRNDGAVTARPVVRYLALAGTDGWVSMPEAGALGQSHGAAEIEPYFPDTYADPANRTTYVFSFRNVTDLAQDQVAAQKGRSQLCAPLFYSTVGEEIWVTLTNLGLHLRPDLVDSHTLHWHGFRNAIPFYDGVPESSISVPIGRDFTYVYRPEDAGTYMYHCHFEDVEHVTMGMHGIVFVKPAANDRVNLGPVGPTASSTLGRQKAYGIKDGDLAGETWYDREFAIMISEIDARAHFNDAHIQATDWTDFHADFWTFNGRAYPDTLQPNSVRDANGDLHAQKQNGWVATSNGQLKPNLETILDDAGEGRLASNPLSSLVQCAPGERVLIRFANLGFLNHSIVFPGLEVDVLGRDARFVPDSAQRTKTDTIQIGPGESRDVFVDVPALPDGVDEVNYPFYDRGMSHYTGSADGSDAWVGGQRSAIQVRRNLAAQEKPNGWGGERLWHGEQPLLAHVLTVTGTLRRTTRGRNAGTFVSGSVTINAQGDAATTLAHVWCIDSATKPFVDPTDGNWTELTFDPAHNTFTNARVSDRTNGGTFWLLARDSRGAFSLVTQVV